MNLLKFRKPSRYINSEINSISKADTMVKFALAFPDTYEIGMSHLGFKILYDIINSTPLASAERVFAPWTDLRDFLRESGFPLTSLENSRPLSEFHIVGFTLQYELSYSTVLEMLSLGKIPLYSAERDEGDPVIIAGGPCSVNPAPLSPFIDAFLIGDGEEAVLELLELSIDLLSTDRRRDEFLKALSNVEGFYVPGYSSTPVRRRFIKDLDHSPYPVSPVVPYTQTVHDRINIEISRGCTGGCRFCQAGMVYRPLRERSPERILEIARKSLSSTGYDEVSLTSLSAGDYTQLIPLMKAFNRSFGERKISLSLPSLRVGAVSRDMLRELKSIKKTGFTIAPEAATERLRMVINKDFNEEDFEKALHCLFSEGWLNLKLYFMIGLPTERDEDIEAIPSMAIQALKIAKRHTGRYVNITVSISPFVPKPHTPFQWFGQEPVETLEEKIQFLRKRLKRKGINLKVHNLKMSLLEAACSRGGSEYAEILAKAHEYGCYLEGWSDNFNYSLWERAMDSTGTDLTAIATRDYKKDYLFPWDIVDVCIKKEFLYKEYERATRPEWTSDCNTDRCHACGLGCKSREFIAKPEIRRPAAKQYNMHRFSPVKVRVQYTRKGKLRYLSHLEMTSVILRGLRRAGVALAYTKGFSPAPKVSFGPPLSVGVNGENEYLDMEVYPPFDPVEYREIINKHMPDGLTFKDMAFIHKKLPSLSSFITMYEYEIRSESADRRWDAGSRVVAEGSDINEFVEGFDIIDEKTVRLLLTDLPEKKVKLSMVINTLFDLSIEDLEITRTGLYGWKDGWVTPMEALTRQPATGFRSKPS
jgi:radical SAM family uncharacterized protein/radical SAM-linked protein